MKLRSKHSRPRVLSASQFLATSIIGSLTMGLVGSLASPEIHIIVLGIFISILGGLLVSLISRESDREQRRDAALEQLNVPMALSADKKLFASYSNLCSRLLAIGERDDEVLREFTLLKLSSVEEELELLGRGEVVFSGTESWRTVYERLLTSSSIDGYRSVAWIKSEEYWQDQPGQNSTQLNIRLNDSGLHIERIAVIRDHLWPRGDTRPVASICNWLSVQAQRGIKISVLRESELMTEQDLLCDFGIYGTKAVGIQVLDDQSRTLQFKLLFDSTDVKLFNDRYDRILLFARKFSEKNICY